MALVITALLLGKGELFVCNCVVVVGRLKTSTWPEC